MMVESWALTEEKSAVGGTESIRWVGRDCVSGPTNVQLEPDLKERLPVSFLPFGDLGESACVCSP